MESTVSSSPFYHSYHHHSHHLDERGQYENKAKSSRLTQLILGPFRVRNGDTNLADLIHVPLTTRKQEGGGYETKERLLRCLMCPGSCNCGGGDIAVVVDANDDDDASEGLKRAWEG